MKFPGIFILCFIVMSLLPFLWNQFSFAEAGFPFPYLQKTNYEATSGTGIKISIKLLNLIYDLIAAATFAWVLGYFQRYYLKGRTQKVQEQELP